MPLHYFGKIVKTHGLDGFLSVACEANLLSNIDFNEPIFLEIKGLSVPFFIKEYRILTETTILILLLDFDNFDQAKRFISNKIYIETDESIPLTLNDEQQFIGYQIIDNNKGLIGTITDIIVKNQNLFIINSDDNEILLPIVDSFFDSIDDSNKIIYMNIPDGIIG